MPDTAVLRYLAVTALEGWGTARVAAVVQAYGTLAGALVAAADRQPPPATVPPALFRTLAGRLDLAQAERRLREARAGGLEVLCWDSAGYPQALWQAPDVPPPLLFVQGTMAAEARLPHPEVRAAALVGTRRASGRGMAFARSVASRLAEAGITVVSGLAIGIDTAAHEGAVDAGGPTTAVLGGGHAHLHPPGNHDLAARILAHGGAIVSEYPPDTVPAAFTFPRRNRLISGLARVVAVIEAGARSGASITAGHALEQGRELFAAPGRPGDPQVAGTLALLRDGAQILTEAEDLLRVFDGPEPRAAPAAPANPPPPSADPLLRAFEELDEPGLEELAQHSALPIAALLGRLTALEVRGLVVRTETGRYRLRAAASARAGMIAGHGRGRRT